MRENRRLYRADRVLRGLGAIFSLVLVVAGAPVSAAERPGDFQDEEVRISRDDAGIVLAGTLSLPAGKGPHPGVLFLTGSGGQTRDQVISGLPMFQVIGNHLAQRGIAVLRVDDRGTGESTGPGARESTTADRAADATAAFRYLVRRPEVDANRAGLLGHSEGTLTAAMMAASVPEVRFLVLLSPWAVPGADLWVWQQGEILRREGEFSPEKIRSIEKELTGLVRHIGLEGDTDEGFYAHGRAACLAWGDPPEEITEAFVEDAFGDLRQKWYEYFFASDPRPFYEKIRQPLLALLGSEDQQTPRHLSLPPLVEALLTAGNTHFTVTVLPGEDHFFMKGEGLKPNEHVLGKMKVSEEALRVISDWLAREVVREGSVPK